MTSKRLWVVAVVVPGGAEELIAALFEAAFGQVPCIYQDEETRASRISHYTEQPPLRFARAVTALRRGLADLRSLGLPLGRAPVRVRRVPLEDWAESWKRHFKPIEIGGKLLIQPSWSRRRPRRGQAVVVLDPGLSFGTGQHATTAFCLRELAARRGDGAGESMLDIGTGSGILAIAAAKLGYVPVVAFDFDPVAVRVARENAARNPSPARVRIARRDLTRLPRQSRTRFDVVCANLTYDLLVSESRRILNRLKPGGVLVLAGILDRQFDIVRQHYERAGMRMVRTRREKEWRSGSFIQPGK